MEFENSSIEVAVDNCESINEGVDNFEGINEGVDNFEGINEGVFNFQGINEGEDHINENEEDENFVIDLQEICEEVENVVNEGRFEVFDSENGVIVYSLDDIFNLDLHLSPHELKNVQFVSVEMAYLFYYWFARVNGFAARKSKILRNIKGEKLQQTFVCFKEGFRDKRGLNLQNRKRKQKPETRCGCEAKLRVHIDSTCGLWYITYFVDEHNHCFLEDKYCRMLASHRDMSELDIMQLNKMRKVGISTPQIYGSLADDPGGYERLSFCKKDIYNQIGRQRRLQGLDSKCALEFLNGLKRNDPLMYVGHSVDDENRL
ncbi:protein FAR1-RELATED SEQUENCE 5-like [Cajanus cajan]|uniref:protein FAR1-RELATED SEQUENCE 5-like n=1 Tax=Cajanus cajan TaxID=3821 RepID=UPI00098DB9A5|nr:protein FAR1-RELATED SEQUENCE 5-like [Cajanus cajan]